jgi:plastocyanin
MSRFAVLLSTAAVVVGVAACGSSNSNSSKSSSSAATAPAASTTAAATASTPAATTASTPAATTASTPASTASTSTTTSTPASSASTGSSTLAISAPSSGMLMFSTTSLHAKAGKVTIAFTNDATFGHNLTLATSSGTVVGATPTFVGGTKSLTVTLKAGKYTYYCSVPGHRQAGMQGTLTVS